MALTDNIVAYYKLDESSGNAADSVGTNTGINTGVTFGSGKINNCAIFDASTDKLACGTGLGFTGSFSYSLWIKTSTSSTCHLMYQSGSSIIYALSLISGSNIQMNVNYSSVDHYSRSTGLSLNNNSWHHIVATIDTSTGTIYLYVDGVEVSYANKYTSGLSIPSPSATQYIGQDGGNGANYVGSIDELGIWGRALSLSEASSLYNSGSGLQYPFGSTVNSNFFNFF